MFWCADTRSWVAFPLVPRTAIGLLESVSTSVTASSANPTATVILMRRIRPGVIQGHQAAGRLNAKRCEPRSRCANHANPAFERQRRERESIRLALVACLA